MTNFTRKFLREFAEDNKNTNLQIYGSAAAATPATSSDPEQLQSNENFKLGWRGATFPNASNSTFLPQIDEWSALNYISNYHLNYLLQKGLPEYNAQTTYYIGDLCRDLGGTILYQSLTDDNVGNPLNDVVNWQVVGDLADLSTISSLGTAAFEDIGVLDGQIAQVTTDDKLDPIIENNMGDLLATAIANNSASIQFSSSLDTSTYSDFVVQISNLRSNTNAVELFLRMNGNSGGADYRYAMVGFRDDGTNTDDSDAADNAIVLVDNAELISNVANRTYNATIKLYGLDSTDKFKITRSEIAYLTDANDLLTLQHTGAFVANTNAITDIEFSLSAGTIAEGTFTLYGIRK